MPQVFISHAGEDYQYIKDELKLPDLLRSNNFQPWISKDDIKGGRWYDQISEAINKSDRFIIVMSHNSQKSDFVDYELNRIMSRIEDNTIPPNRIIPLRIDDCDVTGFRLGLDSYNYINAQGERWNTTTRIKLLNRLNDDTNPTDTNSLSTTDDESSNREKSSILKLTDEQRQKIIRALDEVFTEAEIKTICKDNKQRFEGNIYNRIEGNTVDDRFSDLIDHLNRKGRLIEFINILKDKEPRFRDLISDIGLT